MFVTRFWMCQAMIERTSITLLPPKIGSIKGCVSDTLPSERANVAPCFKVVRWGTCHVPDLSSFIFVRADAESTAWHLKAAHRFSGPVLRARDWSRITSTAFAPAAAAAKALICSELGSNLIQGGRLLDRRNNRPVAIQRCVNRRHSRMYSGIGDGRQP